MITRPGRFFTWDELSTTGTGLPNDPPPDVAARLVALCAAVLDPLREHLGRPVRISSGYRSPGVNRAVGGATTSQHLVGEAADLSVAGLSIEEVGRAIIASAVTWDQLIVERSGASEWVHVSYRIGANRRDTLRFRDGAYTKWNP
jgi:hypothetical protein